MAQLTFTDVSAAKALAVITAPSGALVLLATSSEISNSFTLLLRLELKRKLEVNCKQIFRYSTLAAQTGTLRKL